MLTDLYDICNDLYDICSDLYDICTDLYDNSRDLYDIHTDLYDIRTSPLLIIAVLCSNRAVGPGREHVKQSVGAACIAMFAYHVWYLTHKRFDYGYNMKVNITIGVCNGVGWLGWCYIRREREYVRYCVLVLLVVAGGMALEVTDFPPIAWFFDAHALWHLSTAPVPYYWYRYVFL